MRRIGRKFNGSGEAGEHPTTESVKGFASGGFHDGGLRIVGENGPELEATGPARYWNASATEQMMRGDGGSVDRDLLRELVAEVRALRAEQRAGDAANVSATKGVTKLLRDVTEDGTAIKTKVAT